MRRFVLPLLASVVVSFGLMAVPSTASAAASSRPAVVAARAYHAAISRRGARYVHGATGPRAFDCSGLTQWAYRHAGRRIPRTAAGQAAWAHRIPFRKAHRGDLVFFFRGGHVYHAAIYAGHHRVFHASMPGRPVGFSRIWTRNHFYARAR
jgi:cell wall-associated NlpC family hydrolase